MNWVNKIIGTCENALNECLRMPFTDKDHPTAPALFRAGAPAMASLPIGPYLNAIVLDKSGSMDNSDFHPSRIAAAKNAIEVFAARRAQLSPKDRLAIIGFDDYARVYLPWSLAGQDLSKALRRIVADGGTDLEAGLNQAYQMILWKMSSALMPRILLLSDGHGDDPIKRAKQIKDHGILIQVIGIGGQPSDVDEAVLKAIATTDASGFTHYWFINDSQSLIDQYEQLSTGIVLRGR